MAPKPIKPYRYKCPVCGKPRPSSQCKCTYEKRSEVEKRRAGKPKGV